MYLIGSIGFSLQSAVTLIFIGWGRLTPQEILFTDLNLLRTLIVLGLLLYRSDRLVMPDRLQTPRPVRPPGHTGQTGLFRLLPILVVNKCYPIFFLSLALILLGVLFSLSNVALLHPPCI